MAASIALAVGMLGPLTTALAVIGSDPGGSTANDDNAAVYQDGYAGAAGYLPVFQDQVVWTGQRGINRHRQRPSRRRCPAGVTAENTTGIFEVGLNSAGQCDRLRPVSGGSSKAGFNGGPHPEFGDFGSNIDGLDRR